MGLPLDPRCAGASLACRQRRPCGVVVGEEPAAAIGCRTPPRRQAEGVAGDGGDEEARVLAVCPPAPRKKRRPAAPAAVARRSTAEFYTGADLEAFFAAHNV